MVKLALSLLAWTALAAVVISEINPRKGLEDPLCHHHHVLKYGDPREVFEEWKQTYGSRYDENDWDDEHRFKIFQQNLAEIESHNWKYHTGQSTYFKGLNQFSAMTHDEFLRYTRQGRHSSRRGLAGAKGRRGGRADFECENDAGELRSLLPQGAAGLPARVNWTERGYVTPVKDQGGCGSCWTFAATGVMEGSYYKTHKKLVSFSEQQIMDCCDGEGCGGCNGGDQEAAYANVYDEGGIETEESYPYQEKKTGVMEGSYYKTHKKLVSFSEQQIMDCCDGEGCGGCNGGDQEAAYANVYDEGGIETEESYPYQEKKRYCRYNASDAVGRIQSCRRINPPGDELELQRSSATLGPISVSVDARFFSDYKGGVFNVSNCSPDDLDHAVLLTGYGTDSNKPYWMVKNSWGQEWGCDGYIYMLRNDNNMCGIATEGTYVVMK